MDWNLEEIGFSGGGGGSPMSNLDLEKGRGNANLDVIQWSSQGGGGFLNSL